MNRIVRKHYPVSKLPEDLREGISEGAEVMVTIEVTGMRSLSDLPPEPRKSRSAQELRESIRRYKTSPDFREATDDPVERIRALRDEWDDR